MKILIVDDDRINSTILHRLLSREGHTVITAGDGMEGVAQFLREEPELVLMDIRMPKMNGYEAAREMKRAGADRFIPIIFLTAVTDDEGLAKCIEAGGDDFLTKPFNRVILQSKIGAMERIRQLHTALRQRTDELSTHEQNLRHELEVGNHLFANIVRVGNLLDAPCLNYWTSPMSTFNGDLLMASYTPAGGLHIMLGDFTGHGLSAAVGALPLSELFYGLTAQGFSIGELAEEMNAKMRAVMPTRMFCAACLIEVDPRQQSLMVWNGGLPDVLITDGQGKLVKRIPSTHLPLGVIPLTRDDRKVEILEMHPDYRVFLYSDGLNEAVDRENRMYGSERLESLFDGRHGPDQLFRAVLADVEQFRGGAKQSDDISLLEIVCARAGEEPPGGAIQQRRKIITPSDWRVAFSLSAETLQSVDPLPLLINTLMGIQAPEGHRERIYTILAELFSNALDHGLLRLDTSIKKTPEGFIQYYGQREERLAALKDGWIRIEMQHTPVQDGGELRLRLEDSGPGFDTQRVASSLEGNLGHGGRGIALVRSMCVELHYPGRGNIAEAVYRWNCCQ
ncbi:MAG: fused response regulator/phosphatase [Magnetococcales bacterium]|nr:fused response regulator/phosphatase [Magnetococcales bacterium]